MLFRGDRHGDDGKGGIPLKIIEIFPCYRTQGEPFPRQFHDTSGSLSGRIAYRRSIDDQTNFYSKVREEPRHNRHRYAPPATYLLTPRVCRLNASSACFVQRRHQTRARTPTTAMSMQNSHGRFFWRTYKLGYIRGLCEVDKTVFSTILAPELLAAASKFRTYLAFQWSTRPISPRHVSG